MADKLLTYKQAVELAKKAGSKFPNVVAGQFAIETDWGRKTANAKNNLFNIKWNDRAADRLKKRGINVKKASKSAKDNQTGSEDFYMEFDSIEDAFKGYQNFIETNPRYSDALKATNEKDYLKGLKKAGYAEDKNYVSVIENIVKTSTGKDLINIERSKSEKKTWDKASESDSYSAYRDYKKELSEENKKYNNGKGKINSETYRDNIYAIKAKYQKEFGEENLKEGMKLHNEEKKFIFENENPNFKNATRYQKEIDALKKKIDLGEYGNSGTGKATKEQQKKLDKLNKEIENSANLIKVDGENDNIESFKNNKKANEEKRDKLLLEIKGDAFTKEDIIKKINFLKSKKNASYANLRLDSNKKIIEENKKILKNSDVNSDEYKEALENNKNLESQNEEISKGFKGWKEKVDYSKYGNKRPGDANTSEINTEIYTQDFSNDFSDLIEQDIYSGVETNYDTPDEEFYNPDGSSKETIDYDSEGGDGQTKKDEPVYDFTEEVERGDLEGNAPYIFGDDEEEKQSAKGFLKENPTAVLSAVLGIKGVTDSQASIPSVGVEDKTALSASFYEYLNNLETISKKGFRPEEEAAYLKKINDGYMASVDLAVQASGGSRAQVLNQAGQLNANKNDALLNFSAQDAQLQRQNLEKYGQALEYKESFNERKDLRTQTNNYREKLADFQQAIQKREGGAALAASSINSLVTSIQDYKETGPGSALARYTEYMNKSLKAKGTQINPETGKIFSNVQEWADYNKKQNDIGTALNTAGIDFGKKFGNLADGTKEEKAWAATKLKSLDRERQVSVMQKMNSNDEFGFKELSGLISDPTAKNPMDGMIDAKGIQMPDLTPPEPSIIDSVVSQFGVKKQANEIDGIDYNEFNNK